VSPPGTLSPIGGKFRGVNFPRVAKSHGPHTNALAYAKRHYWLRVGKHQFTIFFIQRSINCTW